MLLSILDSFSISFPCFSSLLLGVGNFPIHPDFLQKTILQLSEKTLVTSHHPILVYLQLEAPDSKPRVSNLPSAGSLEPPHTQLEDVPETAGKKCQKSLDWGDNFGVHFKVPIHGKKYIDLIFTCICIRLISPLLFFSRISRGFSGCCLDSIKRPYLGMRGFCFIIQAKTSPACSINWNTSQVERDSASATELVMRTRPRAYSFDSYPCTGRPDVPEKLQRMTPHSS